VNERHDPVLALAYSSIPPATPGRRSSFQPQVGVSPTALADTLYLTEDTADWVLEAAKKLEDLGRFRADWDSYGGLPLQRGSKQLALRVLGWLRRKDLPVPCVVLGSAGTLQLEWQSRGKELEVGLRDDNSIEYVKAFPSGRIEEGVDSYDLQGRVQDLTAWLVQC
jgi:hypothetical protein